MNNVRKPLIIGAVAVAAFVFLWVYVNDTLQKSKAAQSLVNISFVPASATSQVSQDQGADVIIQAPDTKKISGVDITFAQTGGAYIVDIANPVPLETGDSSFFSQITKNINSNTARIVAVAQKPDNQLPQAVKIHIVYRGTDQGGGTITVNQATTKIVGNTEGSSYGFGTVGQFSGTFAVPTPTTAVPTPTRIPTPTATPTRVVTPTRSPTQRPIATLVVPTSVPTVAPSPTRTPTPTPQPCPKARGDANCDYRIDITDFEIWRKEFTGELTTKTADFNASATVDLTDFEIWRSNYFANIQ